MEEKLFSWLMKRPKLVSLIIRISKLDKNVIWANTQTILIILWALYLNYAAYMNIVHFPECYIWIK